MRNLTLLTDLYQLTMMYGYFKNGMTENEGVFDLFFGRAAISPIPSQRAWKASSNTSITFAFLKKTSPTCAR